MTGAGTSLPPVSGRALEHGRTFLSALFMALRTAQIHDATNRAFDNAIRGLHRAASDLYATLGAVRLQFVDDAIYLNGRRLRFEGGSFATMRTLKSFLELQAIGGLELRSQPTPESLRTLILRFADKAGAREATPDDQIATLGLHVHADEGPGLKVDRRILAVQSYAKLLLAARTQRSEESSAGAGDVAPQIRSVRTIQDLIDLCADRADYVWRLAFNRRGAGQADLYGPNVCLSSLALGHAAGVRRRDLVDLGLVALFHQSPSGGGTLAGSLDGNFARMLRTGGGGRSSVTRALVFAQLKRLLTAEEPPLGSHLYARIIAVAAGVQTRFLGLGPSKGTLEPLGALDAVGRETSGRYDPDLVNLLVNILRAFPEGAEVVLDTGAVGVVRRQAPKGRWDRPVVELSNRPGRMVDLMEQEDGRFCHRLVATARFLARDSDLEGQGTEPSSGSLPPVTADIEDAPPNPAQGLHLPSFPY